MIADTAVRPRSTLLVFAVGVLAVATAWSLRTRWLEASSRPAEGPLQAYVVPAREAPACSGAACGASLVRPQPGTLGRVLPVQYEAPPTELLQAGPGRALVPLPPGMVYTTGAAARQLAFVRRAWPPASAGGDVAAAPHEPIELPQHGHVLTGRDARSGEQRVFANATLERGDEQRAYSQLSFQPVPTLLPVRWPADVGALPPHGEAMTLHLVPPGEPAGVADRPVEVRLHLSSPGQRPHLALEPASVYRLLAQRLSQPGDGLRPVLPDRLWLEWRERAEAGEPRWRVPAGALQRDKHGVRLWLSIDGWAVPVMVEDLQAQGAQRLVRELPGAHGLPVRPADWVQMGSGARRATFRAAAGHGMRLLDDTPRLVAEVPGGLLPGAGLPRP